MNDWAALYWPQLVSAAFSGLATVVGGIVLYLVRRQLAALLGTQASAAEGAEHAEQGAISASQTAEVVGGLSGRLRAVERAVEGMKDAVSGSLGTRATEDLRFRRVEARLAELEQSRGGTHGRTAGADQLPGQGDSGSGGGDADRAAAMGSFQL